MAASFLASLGALAHQLKNLLNVLKVALPSLNGFRVTLGVIVAVGQTQATLIDLRDHLLGIVGILRRTGAEKYRTAVSLLQARDQRRYFLRRFQACNRVQIPLDGSHSLLVRGCFIHARSVKVANFRRDKVALVAIH